MKAIYHGYSDPLGLIDGKEYEIVGIDEKHHSYSVIDESGEDYMYDMGSFEMSGISAREQCDEQDGCGCQWCC